MEPWTPQEDEDLPDILPGEIVHNENGDLSFKIISQVENIYSFSEKVISLKEFNANVHVLFSKTLNIVTNSCAFHYFLSNFHAGAAASTFILLNTVTRDIAHLHKYVLQTSTPQSITSFNTYITMKSNAMSCIMHCSFDLSINLFLDCRLALVGAVLSTKPLLSETGLLSL